MKKNTVLFVLFSTLTLFTYFYFFSNKPQNNQNSQNQTAITAQNIQAVANQIQQNNQNISKIKEEKINIENDKYKATFSNKGASIISWKIKEKNNQWVDLILPDSKALSTFEDVNFKVVSKSNEKIVFEYFSDLGWKVQKTYNLSKDSYLHNVNIKLSKAYKSAKLPKIAINVGPGLGTDEKEMKENTMLTRALAFSSTKHGKLKKLKDDPVQASIYKWAAIDNRYFLIALIPEKSINFDEIIATRQSKSQPYSISLTTLIPQDKENIDYSIDFYFGPKGYTHLKTFGLDLEKSVDFGFFGFLAKIALAVLSFFYNLTNNYGWAIIILTIIIQIIVLPLTIKSFKAAAAMKRIQPMIKEIQDKFKDNPQRLQMEMMNVYKSQKVNPLGGCLPMILQLPIFWAFFQMLRNSFELRNEGWILWVKDLSAADHFLYYGLDIPFLGDYINLLPLIMGIGMFLQQKMTAATSDPAQRKMMYIMPVIFVVIFWKFPAGLVLYWLTNSIFTILVQTFVLKKENQKPQVKVTRIS